MAWLTSLLKKPEAEEAPVVEEELTPEELPPPHPAGPQIAVLVPDTAGISSFRLATLPSAGAASEHIASLRADIRHETHAFWALHDRPIVDASTQVEALVLIRAHAGSDLVYIVSFLDIESALSFTRFEVRRGLHLGNVMIYWAAFAQLREELDGVSITPEFAPPTENYVPPVPVREEIHAPEPMASTAVAEPEIAPEPITEPQPAAEPEIDAETMQAVQEYLQEKPKRRIIEPPAEPVAAAAEPEAVVEAPVIEEAPAAEPVALEAAEAATAVEPTFTSDDEDLGPMWPEANAGIAEAEPDIEPEFPTAVPEERAAIKEAFVFQHKTVRFRPLVTPSKLEAIGAENGMLIDDEPERLAPPEREATEELAARLAMEPEPVETIPGDEELEFLPLGSADPAAGLAAMPRLDDFDIAYEVERLLRGRKFEQRDGPFSGFQSPPGRF